MVKNSTIHTDNGTLPSDYLSTVGTSKMEDAPWMLGISGNVRATDLLGTGTKASSINSSVTSEGWGALSTDNGQNGQLTAIDSEVGNTGEDGYGSYAIGNATERFLGVHFTVGTYAAINRGGAQDTSFDTTTVNSTDAVATFTGTVLKGDFYNGYRGSAKAAKNMVLTFDNTKVTNTPQAAIDNGAIVSLTNGSQWTVTGTSYLTSLTVAKGARLTAPKATR